MNLNIDSAIFIGFLAVNLAVGLFYGKEVRSIREYAIGGRNFSTITIVATLVATWISGGSFSLYMSETYSQGLHFILSIFADAGSFLIIGCIFAPRMAEFLGQLSVAEAMGSLYGKHVRIITAITGFIGTIGALALQFKVSSTVLSYLFGISDMYATLASSLVVIAYSTFGGIRSVTFTDLIQFFMFGTIIPIMIFVIWNTMDNSTSVVNTLTQNPLFDYRKVFDYQAPKFWTTLTIFLYFLIPGLSPATFQRITMASNITQVQRSFCFAAVVLLLVELLIAWIAILVLSQDANLDPNNLVNYIIDNYAYVGLKGLIVIGIMAMVMSTADSYINSAAVLFAHDVCKPLGFASEKNELFLSRFFSIMLGSIALAFTFSGASFLNLFLLGYSFYMIVVTIPFIMAILGFRSTTKSVIIGMAAGVFTVLIWSHFGQPEIDSVLPGMVANMIAFVGSHYLLRQPGGWVGIKDETPLQVLRDNRKRNFKKLISNLKQFNLWDFCKKNTPKHDYVYPLFGLFCIISVFSAMYSIPKETQLQHQRILEFIYHTAVFSSSILLTFPVWPSIFRQEKFIIIAWNIMLPYLLIFAPTLLIIVSNLGQFQLMIFLLNMVVISLMLRWQVAILMICFAVFSSVQSYKWYIGGESINATIDLGVQFKIMYALLFMSSILIAFLKPKQEYLEATEHKVGELETETENLSHEISNLSGKVSNLNEQVTYYSQLTADQEKEIERLGATAQKILNNVNHELRLPIGNVVNFSEMLYETLGKSDNKLVKELSKEVYDNSNRVSSMILNMLDLATLDVKKVDLRKKTINFSELVEDRVKTCRKIYLRDKKIDFELRIEPEILVSVDPNYIRQTVDNLVINSINFSTEGLIKVSVSKQKGQVIFTITDQGKGIPKAELDDIFTPFKMGSNSESKACGRGVGLALCKSAVEAHGGSITADSEGECGAELQFTLPLKNNQ
jgi:Na+/proline symporter/signal transduction histidine kinase